MWSRRAALGLLSRAAALGLAGGALGGCGFHPLYGSRSPGGAVSANPAVDQQLAGIRIEAIPNRLGQQLHNALRDRFNPLGQPVSSSHRLAIDLVVRIYGALARSDLSATRRNVEITAFYKLTDNAGNVILTDTSQSNTGYDEFDDPLNDLTANQYAQERSTLELADMIKTRIAAFFAQNAAHAAP